MKRLLSLLLVSFLLFGCTAGPNAPAATAAPSAPSNPTTPVPSINAEESAAVQLAIGQAEADVPVSSGFLARLAGVTPTAPSEYRMTSEGAFSMSLTLIPLTQMDFSNDDFSAALKTIASASHYQKTASVSTDGFSLTWNAQDADFKTTKSLQVDLNKRGKSSVCIVEQAPAVAKASATGQWSFAGTAGLAAYHIGDSIDAGNGVSVTVKDITPGANGNQVTLELVNENGIALGARTFVAGQSYGTNGITVTVESIAFTVGQTPSVQLSISGASSPTPVATALPAGWTCVSPSQSQVKQLWSALQGNAVDDALQLLIPGITLKDVLQVQKTGENAYAGRPCTGYALSLTSAGIAQLNQLGAGAKLSDLSGSICLDSQYGFPLKTEIKSTMFRLSEDVTGFSDQKGQNGKSEAVAFKKCVTPFTIDDFRIAQKPASVRFPSDFAQGLGCFARQKFPDENTRVFANGDASAKFTLPSGARNAQVYLSKAGPALCNAVSINGENQFDSTGKTFEGFPVCSLDAQKFIDLKSSCPHNNGEDISKTVGLSGPDVEFRYTYRDFDSGYLQDQQDMGKRLGLTPDQYVYGNRLSGEFYYEAPRCAYRFASPSTTIGTLYDNVFGTGSQTKDIQYPTSDSDGKTLCKSAGRATLKTGECVIADDGKTTYQLLGVDLDINPYGPHVLTFRTVCQYADCTPRDYDFPISGSANSDWFDVQGAGFKQVHVWAVTAGSAIGDGTVDAEFFGNVVNQPTSVPAPTNSPAETPTTPPSVTPSATPKVDLACKGNAGSCGVDGQCHVCGTGQFCQVKTCTPAKNTALIVSDASISNNSSDGTASVALNAREKAADALITAYDPTGSSVIQQSQATYDALSMFKNIVATDYYPNSPFNAETVGKLEGDGKKIVLLRDAIGFANDGDSLSEQDNMDLTITKNEAFLSNYDPWKNEDYYPNIHVQDGGKSFQNRGMLNNLATSDHCCYRVSSFYANNSAGGRIAAWGYDPSQLSSEGKVMADQIFRWSFGINTPSDAVPSGTAALIVQDYAFDSSAQPVLTAQETALKVLLEAEGQKVFPVRQSRRFTSDYSGASLVAASHFPGLRLSGFYHELTNRKPGIFMFQSAALFSNFGEGIANPIVTISSDNGASVGKTYLSHYDASADHNGYLGLNLQTSNSKGYCRNNLGGWTQIAAMPASQGCGYGGTLFSRESSGIRSALIGHDPSALNDEGKVLFDEAYRWALKDNHYTLSVPAGNVGLLINDFNNPAALTDNESAFKTHLESVGYKVTAVPQTDRFKTDFTQAAFLSAIEDGIWNKYSFSGTLGALAAYAPRAVFIGPAIGLATDGRQPAEDTRNPAGGHPWEGMHLNFGYNGQLGHDVVTEIGPKSTGIYTKSAYHFGGIWKGAAQQWTCCSAYTVWTAAPSGHSAGLLFGYTFTQLNTDGLKYLDARMADVAAKR
ncbi:hypothetical protein HY994_00960 [Candidatus Micrarchaeota archaeon]|nr:hypothetical protein [Candidatus Micrarchaeota archaeon]